MSGIVGADAAIGSVDALATSLGADVDSWVDDGAAPPIEGMFRRRLRFATSDDMEDIGEDVASADSSQCFV